MNTGTISNARRRLTALVIAAVFALSAAFAPVLLGEVAGTSLTDTAAACDGRSGGW